MFRSTEHWVFTTQPAFVQSQQEKHQNNVWNLFKVKNKEIERRQGQKVQLSEAYLGSHETSMIEW